MSTGRSLLHTSRVLLGLDAPASQTTPAERAAIRRYARGARAAVEIGVYEGLTTALIAGALDAGGVVHAIDPFFRGRLGICWGEVIARHHLRREGLGKRVRLVRALSWDACRRIGGTFDFLFVDGDHSLDGISRDWRDWAPRVRAGGHVALHDTRPAPANPAAASLDSVRFFEEVIRHDPRFEVVEQVDTLSVLRRRDEG